MWRQQLPAEQLSLTDSVRRPNGAASLTQTHAGLAFPSTEEPAALCAGPWAGLDEPRVTGSSLVRKSIDIKSRPGAYREAQVHIRAYGSGPARRCVAFSESQGGPMPSMTAQLQDTANYP
jgi:hypothetical protein